jgi:hypothetical protein
MTIDRCQRGRSGPAGEVPTALALGVIFGEVSADQIVAGTSHRLDSLGLAGHSSAAVATRIRQKVARLGMLGSFPQAA